MKKEDIVDENEETEEALELETLEVETQLVEEAVKVESVRRLTDAEIESRYQAFIKKIGGK